MLMGFERPEFRLKPAQSFKSGDFSFFQQFLPIAYLTNCGNY